MKSILPKSMKGVVGTQSLSTRMSPITGDVLELPLYDAYGNRTWVVNFHGNALKFIFNTQNNRDNARRTMNSLEWKTPADLQNLQNKFKSMTASDIRAICSQCRSSDSLEAKSKNAAVSPVTKSDNTFVEVTVRIRDATGVGEEQVIRIGEFVHIDNAMDQYKTAVAVVKGVAALAGAKP